jgi:cobalt-zinc-cadmium efflux system outer membrane protein
MKRILILLILIIFIWLPSRALAARDSDIRSISKDVSSRTDFKVERMMGDPHELLKEPLTAQKAVQIALSNNQSLQALLESWGIAKADFNKTRLPENPVFGASVRFPEQDELPNNTEFSLEQDFVSFVLFPLRSNFAGAQLHKAELQITKEILDLVFEVKSAFYEVQGHAAMLVMRKRVLGQAEASAELARRQLEAGNISELDYANEKALYQEARVEYLKAEADFILQRENLNRLMGFGGQNPSWEIKEELQEIQASEPSYEELLSMGMSNRLDLLIARKNVEAQRHALSLNRFGVLGHPEVGISTEKDADGGRVTGPTLRTEVPIYDLGQTAISKSGAELKEAELRLKAIENDVRSEIRQKRDKLFAIRTLVEEYRNAIIPVREKITGETQKHYNYMLLGNYDLIRAKQNEILANKEYIDSLKEYWIARSNLEKAVSSKLVLSKSIDKGMKKEESSVGMSHANHGGK